MILLIHAGATWALIGLIWTIQQVHYPLFAFIGTDAFPAYEVAHVNRILLLVFPLMLVELLTAIYLTVSPPANIPSLIFWTGLTLVIFIWLATVFINLPQHNRLVTNFDSTTHQALVTTNWLRTLLWTIRGGLMGWVLWQLLEL